MEENKMFEEPTQTLAEADGKAPLDVPSLVLGIIAIVAALLIPLVSYVCGIIGLVFAIRRRKVKRTMPGLILSIVGIVAGVASHAYTTMKVMEAMQASGVI